MNNLAVHMRISGVTVGDNDVESRRAAATSLAGSWGKEKIVATIVAKAADVAATLGGDGNSSPALGDEIQLAIQKKSPSFLYEERPLDVGVCAGMAMVSIFSAKPGNTGWLIVDVYATALWLALAYQPVLLSERRENLRREVLTAAADWSATSAQNARERDVVPDPSDVEITIGSENKVSSDFQEAMAETVEALRRNAILDREELDFLWWAQLRRSRLLKRQFSEIVEPTRIIAAGIEGAKMLRRLPCEVHREIVLCTLDQDPELDLVELLAAIGDDRAALSATLVKSNILAFPNVFPLLHALSTGEVDRPGASLKRRVSEWGERALLETTFVRLMSVGTGKV